jgi:hypothetical protein
MKYTLSKSTRKHKKYMATFCKTTNNKKRSKIVHFGDNRYQQWKDSTGLNLYSYLNHGDTRRKNSYYDRFGKNATIHSAKWFSHKYLW